ncbi:hypothetical protein Tco_0836633 [Tanacetum coccineum]
MRLHLILAKRSNIWPSFLQLSWPDSHDHLFFNCPYASNIWHMISSKGNMLSGMQSLSNVVRLMETRPKRSNIWQVVDKLIISSTVYHIWNERNKRIFQNCKRTVEEIVMIITRNIEEMLMSLRVKKSKVVDKAAEETDIQEKEQKESQKQAIPSTEGPKLQTVEITFKLYNFEGQNCQLPKSTSFPATTTVTIAVIKVHVGQPSTISQNILLAKIVSKDAPKGLEGWYLFLGLTHTKAHSFLLPKKSKLQVEDSAIKLRAFCTPLIHIC